MERIVTAAEFEDLYRATARDVFTYVRRRTASDAEEIVAEAYAVAWRRRVDLPPPMLRRAWLFGVARTLLLAHGRRQQREEGVLQELATLPVHEPQIESSEHTVRVMATALTRLAPAHRELLRLVAWEGLTPAELAVTLGIRPANVRLRLHRARQALARDPEVLALIDGASVSALPPG